MKQIKIDLVVGLLLLSFAAVLTHGQEAVVRPSMTKQQWREDVKYFASELAKRHKNAYHAVTKEQYDAAVARLDADIANLDDHQIIVRMIQIAAMVGDGHTSMHVPQYFKFYPLGLYWFGKELRVTGTTKDYERIMGMKVVKVGDLNIDEVQARISTCFPSAENENEWFVLSASPAFIIRPEILHALGIASAIDHAEFTFEEDGGKRTTIDLKAVNGVPAGRFAITIPGMVSAASTPPLSRQRPGEKFWFTNIADQQVVYANWRGYDTLGDDSDKLFKFVDEVKPRKLIIDMRQNGGGDFFKGRKYIVEQIKKRPDINQKGHLFVLIGRRTFSAALANAIDLRKETNATLVGEPIGERPNSYSENNEITLPNSRLVASYSSKYYKFLDEEIPAVMPDQRIDPTWTDFKAGRDAAMEWILSL